MTAVDVDPETPLPPCDLDAERSLLGAVLISGPVLDEVADLVTVADLYQPAHQTIYAACLELYAAGDPIDPVSVADRLRQQGDLVRVGGAPYLHTLTAAVPTAASAGYYAEIVARVSLQRRVMTLGQRITQLGLHGDDDLTGRVESLTAALSAEDSQLGEDVTELDAAVEEAMERLRGPVPPLIPTGLQDLDDIMTGGLRTGGVYVVGARPGHGKSLVAANIAVNVAQSGLGVLICSLEMTSEAITDRILANLGGVELGAIMRHHLSEYDWGRLHAAREKLRGIPLLIRDTPHLTPAGLRRVAERAHRRLGGLGLIVIDYAQLMTPTDPRVPREQQVAEISRSTKHLAMHLQVPVILLAQTNRKSMDRTEPDASDLRESGALEADAEAVIILRPPAEDARAGELDAFLPKNRNGRPGRVTLAWSPHYSRVRSLAPLRSVS